MTKKNEILEILQNLGLSAQEAEEWMKLPKTYWMGLNPLQLVALDKGDAVIERIKRETEGDRLD